MANELLWLKHSTVVHSSQFSTSDVFKNCLFEKLRRLLVETLVVLT